jgi:multiple sugar transport system substrate-binding protein
MKRFGRSSAGRSGKLFLAACAAASLLTGCHGPMAIDTFSVPEKFDSSRNMEITFWAKNDTNKTQTKIYADAIDSFEKLYPNVKVNLRLYTNYGDIYNDVITNIATRTTPNVCITYPDHIATYKTGANVVVPLDELIADEQYGLGGTELAFDGPSVSEVIPQFLEEGKIDGVTYAIPFMRSTEACYVNKSYVEKLGYELPEVLTWDFIWEVSEAAMEKDKNGNFLVNGQNVLIPFIYKSTDNIMIQMLKQLNAGYSTDGGEILLFNDTTKQLLQEIGGHAQTRAFSTFAVAGYPANFLNAGQCIFAVDSTAGATWMGSDAPLVDISESKLVQFETAVRMVPQADPENPQMISQGPSVCIFNKPDSQEVLASWLFAQYLMTDDVQIAYSSTEGYVPVTGKARENERYQDYLARKGEDNKEHYSVKIEAAELMLDNVEHTFVTPVFNGSASLRDAAGHLVEDTVKSARRKKPVDEAYFSSLFADTEKLYRLDQIASSSGGKKELGPLPATSIALLAGLAVIWLLIGCYMLTGYIKKRKTENKQG